MNPKPDIAAHEDREGQAIRDAYAAIERLYETIPAAFAWQFATDARDDADRNYRRRTR